MAGFLHNSPAEVLTQLLIDRGLVTEGQAAVANEPDMPDLCVTVYDTSPLFQGRQMHGGVVWEYYGVQVRVRAQRPDTAMRLARTISSHLETEVYDATVRVADEHAGTATTEYRLHSCRRQSGPIPLGKQQPSSMRSIVTVNLLLTLKQVG